MAASEACPHATPHPPKTRHVRTLHNMRAMPRLLLPCTGAATARTSCRRCRAAGHARTRAHGSFPRMALDRAMVCAAKRCGGRAATRGHVALATRPSAPSRGRLARAPLALGALARSALPRTPHLPLPDASSCFFFCSRLSLACSSICFLISSAVFILRDAVSGA